MKKFVIFVAILAVAALLGYVPAANYLVANGLKEPAKPSSAGQAFTGARMHMWMQNFPKAREAFQKALQRFPKSEHAAKMTYMVAFCYEKEHKIDDAAKWYQSFLARYPTDVWAKQAKFRLAHVAAP